MKAFLLASGHGTRLRPITDSIPKCLVPICGRPLLNIWLELCACSGITEVLINLHAHADFVEQHLRRNPPPVRVNLTHEEHLLGSAGTVAANRSWIGSDAAFWIFYSDVLTNTDLKKIWTFHDANRDVATLALYQVPDPSRCGVVLTDGAGVITEFVEKPQLPRSDWVFSGIMVAGPELFDAIPPDLPADISFHLLPRLLGKMRAYRLRDYVLDIGTLQNYEEAQISWPGLHDELPGRNAALTSIFSDEREKRATGEWEPLTQ